MWFRLGIGFFSLCLFQATAKAEECMSSRMSELGTALNEQLSVSHLSNGVSSKEFAYVRLRLGGYLKSAASDIEAIYLHRGVYAAFDARGGNLLPLHPRLKGRVPEIYRRNLAGAAWITLVFKDRSQAMVSIPNEFLSGHNAQPIATRSESAKVFAPVTIIAKQNGTNKDQIFTYDRYTEGQFERITDMAALIANSGWWEITSHRLQFLPDGAKQVCLSSYMIQDDLNSIRPAYVPVDWKD